MYNNCHHREYCKYKCIDTCIYEIFTITLLQQSAIAQSIDIHSKLVIKVQGTSMNCLQIKQLCHVMHKIMTIL